MEGRRKQNRARRRGTHLSSQSVLLQVTKNWQPLVLGPELAIESNPAWWRRRVRLRLGFGIEGLRLSVEGALE